MVDSDDCRIEILDNGLGKWTRWILTSRDRTEQRKLRVRILLARVCVEGSAATHDITPGHDSEHAPDSRVNRSRKVRTSGNTRSYKKRPGGQEIADIGLPYSFLAAENEIAERGSLVASEEERFVFANRPAERTAKLIAFHLIRGCRRREKVLRVKRRIAIELKRIAVKTVRSRFGDHVHHAAGIRSVLCTVIARLHAELLQCVRKWERLVHVCVFIHVIAAVQLVTDRVLPRAIRGKSYRAGKSFRGALIGAAVRRV